MLDNRRHPPFSARALLILRSSEIMKEPRPKWLGKNTLNSPANPAPSHEECARCVIHRYPVDTLLMTTAGLLFLQLSPSCTFKFTSYPHKTLFRFKRLCLLPTLSTNLFIFLFVYIYFEIEKYRCAQHTSTGKAHQPWNAL